ncbi:hypothetical protein MPSI1_001765 [Malassezia psittaci]|uniref:Glucosidase 2 subunit beta n=1 Tax=Malassezia psittaci TaxID=1821823 RepID=A0AAF0F9B5_9BASI|nr:hypothetical protein MPSI1_001765 [Malassezia psittaci]
MWKCLGTNQVIPYRRINDDYCDCDDGSDEPGTSACDNGRFYCENKGHIPKYIRSSFVNDGVCDCCDGSDEVEGKTHCANVCAEVNKKYRKDMAESNKKFDKGARIRNSYIATAAKDREFHESNIARLQAELPEAEQTERYLKQALEDSETVGAWFEQQKRSSPLFAQLELRQSMMRTQREIIDTLAGELHAIGKMLERIEKDSSTEELESVQNAFQIWLGRSFDENDNERVATLEEKIDALLNSHDDLSEEDLEIVINEDPLALLDGAPDYSGQDRPSLPPACKWFEADKVLHIPSYLPEAMVSLYERGLKWVADWLIRLQVVSPKQGDRPASGHPYQYTAGVAAARDAYEKSCEATKKIKADIEFHQNRLNESNGKFGRYGEFKQLDGTCLKRDMGEYTYEFCFGGSTSQISNNDGFTFKLGRFDHFDWQNKYSKDDDRHYLSMLYDRGQTCWNGPMRSTRVNLECSDTNELLDVFEAEKCTYSMRVATPAVCFPPEQSIKQEEIEHTEL